MYRNKTMRPGFVLIGTNQLLVKMRASLYSLGLTRASSTMPDSRRAFRLQCMMTREKTANKAVECARVGPCSKTNRDSSQPSPENRN